MKRSYPTVLSALALALLLSLIATLSVHAQGFRKKRTYADLSTALDTTALQPGKKAMLVLVVDVKEGFHAQAHEPLDAISEKFKAQATATGSVKIGDIIYPPGEVHTYKFGEAKVYSGKTYLLVPIEVPADAPVGEVTISGTISYQACDASVCYQPVDQEFSITTKIVAASEKVSPANEEITQGNAVCLQKPFALDVLERKVRSLLDAEQGFVVAPGKRQLN